MTPRYVLPRLQIPDHTWLLYESMVMMDPDRTGNWRFMIDEDGCLYSARNTQLWLTEANQFLGDDPALTWNTSFGALPARCLSDTQVVELADAIRKTRFPALKALYASQDVAATSSPVVERWTLVEEGVVTTVVVEEGGAPLRLIELRATIDRLIAAAPRLNT